MTILGLKKGIPSLVAARLQRWVILIPGYHYEIEFRSTHQHCNADSQSWLLLNVKDCKNGSEATICSVYQEKPSQSHPKKYKGPLVTIQFSVVCFTSHEIVGQSLYLEGWSHLMPSRTRFQWWRIVYSGVCMSLFQNGYKIFYTGELHLDHQGSSRMKSLDHSHLGVFFALTKNTSCCSLHLVWPSKSWQYVCIKFADTLMDWMFLLLVDAHSKLGEVIDMASPQLWRVPWLLFDILLWHMG